MPDDAYAALIDHYEGVGKAAHAIGVSRTMLHFYKNRNHLIPIERARHVEDDTGGVVTLAMMRPDIYA